MAVASNLSVRRLTPTECERLQGFPDGFTQIPWRNKPAENCPDGPRYKALGNSMAVPCMRWIGERIQAVEVMTDGQ
jgi:DNA (cytosine-5)-methyltransferase 1